MSVNNMAERAKRAREQTNGAKTEKKARIIPMTEQRVTHTVKFFEFEESKSRAGNDMLIVVGKCWYPDVTHEFHKSYHKREVKNFFVVSPNTKHHEEQLIVFVEDLGYDFSQCDHNPEENFITSDSMKSIISDIEGAEGKILFNMDFYEGKGKDDNGFPRINSKITKVLEANIWGKVRKEDEFEADVVDEDDEIPGLEEDDI